MASDRDTLADKLSECGYEGMTPHETAAAILAAGWRPPVRVITDPAELDELPGRSIVIGLNVPSPGAWQLTSHHNYPRRAANWGSPYLLTDRLSSRQLLDRVGRVAVLWEPEQEGGR